jgi:hypothetical protein
MEVVTKKKRAAAPPKTGGELKKTKKVIPVIKDAVVEKAIPLPSPLPTEELDLTPLKIVDRNLSIPSNTVQPTSEKLNPTEFYLYFDLEKQATTYKPTPSDSENFIKNLKALDETGTRLIFVIMRMHALKTHTGKMFELPYKAKILKELNQIYDLEFDLKDLPTSLQHMLFIFCTKHLKVMKG